MDLGHALSAAIRGAIVHYHDLKVSPPLGQNRKDRALYVALFVEEWNNN